MLIEAHGVCFVQRIFKLYTAIILPAHPESLRHYFSQGLIGFTEHESKDSWKLVELNLGILNGTHSF